MSSVAPKPTARMSVAPTPARGSRDNHPQAGQRVADEHERRREAGVAQLLDRPSGLRSFAVKVPSRSSRGLKPLALSSAAVKKTALSCFAV